MHDRLAHIRKICLEQGVDGFLVSSASNIFYLSQFNRFLVEHDGFLFVTKTNAYIITSPLYTEAVKKFTPSLQVLETTPDVWYSQMVKKIADKEHIQTIGFEERDLRVAEYFDLQEEKISLKSVSLRNLRIQKDDTELAAIQKACEITDQTFSFIAKEVKEGISELALSEKMDAFVKSKGAEIGFPTIVAFGEHSAVPHHMTSNEILQKNSFVLIDFGVKVDSYVSDMSRTVFFGSPTHEQGKLYETVKKSQEAAVAYITSHLSEDIFVKHVDEAARTVIEKEGFPSYPHALGHGVGLEVHEGPTLSAFSPEKLIDRMVFTIEPGIYLPATGGVRIEDVYAIQNNKLQELTHSTKELIVI